MPFKTISAFYSMFELPELIKRTSIWLLRLDKQTKNKSTHGKSVSIYGFPRASTPRLFVLILTVVNERMICEDNRQTCSIRTLRVQS